MMNRVAIRTLLIVAFICACNNPFATREPEAPSEDRSTWLPPIFPDRVITNMKYAIQEGNLINYMKCLTDTAARFKYKPDDLVNQNNQGFFANWSLNSEQNYISKLFTATFDSTRSFRYPPFESIDYQDSVLIKVDYELELQHNLGSGYPKIFKGQSDFWLNSHNGEWYITSWIDNGTEDESSWSSVKVIFGK